MAGGETWLGKQECEAYCICILKPKDEEFWCFPRFLLFVQPGTPDHGMVPPAFMVGFLPSVEKHPHTHSQRYISQVLYVLSS